MNNVVVHDPHAEDGHRRAEVDDAHVRVARPHLAREELEPGCAGVEIAHRAVGDAAGAAESPVDGRVDLAPEGPVSGSGVQILDDGDGAARGIRHVLVVARTPGLDCVGALLRRRGCADSGGARTPDHGRQLRIEHREGAGGESRRPPLRDDHLQRIADRRRVPSGEKREIVRGDRAHGYLHSKPSPMWFPEKRFRGRGD